MQHTSFSSMPCPVARGLEHVGEWWSILIIRDAFRGMTRFDAFQQSLGIAPNILSRRLQGLVESGLLEKRPYSRRPPRHEYILTARGRDFRPVLWAMIAWGNKHFMPDGEAMVLVDSTTGLDFDPASIDSNNAKPLEQGTIRAVLRHSERGRQS
jgi:DNA-binding HxlR family transcriptional regulator